MSHIWKGLSIIWGLDWILMLSNIQPRHITSFKTQTSDTVCSSVRRPHFWKVLQNFRCNKNTIICCAVYTHIIQHIWLHILQHEIIETNIRLLRGKLVFILERRLRRYEVWPWDKYVWAATHIRGNYLTEGPGPEILPHPQWAWYWTRQHAASSDLWCGQQSQYLALARQIWTVLQYLAWLDNKNHALLFISAQPSVNNIFPIFGRMAKLQYMGGWVGGIILPEACQCCGRTNWRTTLLLPQEI